MEKVMEQNQEVINYMKDELNRNGTYLDSYELAEAAADMFDLWDNHNIGNGESLPELPEWLLCEAEDIFFEHC
jgi:hypothetical protein